MAAARHNLTRRAVLGAAFAAPAVLGAPAAAAPLHREVATLPRREAVARWDRALAVLRRSEARLEAFRKGEMAVADRAYHAVRDRWPRGCDFEADPVARAAVRIAFAAHARWEERLNDLECAHLEAITRLLRKPAPDLPALAMKIELAVDYEVAELEGGDRCMAGLKADARRFANGLSALSPQFCHRNSTQASMPAASSRRRCG